MTYGWSLEEIRNLDIYDFHMHLNMCMAKWGIDREFSLNLVGVDTRKKKSAINVKKLKPGEKITQETQIKIDKVLTPEDLI